MDKPNLLVIEKSPDIIYLVEEAFSDFHLNVIGVHNLQHVQQDKSCKSSEVIIDFPKEGGVKKIKPDAVMLSTSLITDTHQVEAVERLRGMFRDQKILILFINDEDPELVHGLHDDDIRISGGEVMLDVLKENIKDALLKVGINLDGVGEDSQ